MFASGLAGADVNFPQITILGNRQSKSRKDNIPILLRMTLVLKKEPEMFCGAGGR